MNCRVIYHPNRAVMPFGAISRVNMQNRVKLKKGALDHFRRMARESPNEIQAYLVGSVVNPNLTTVEYFAYPKRYAVSTPEAVSWYTEDYEQMQKQAEELGWRVVGFIHSHPRWDAVMSPNDYTACVTAMHRVCGIVSVEDRKSRARFWVMDSPLPCEVIYAKSKGTTSGTPGDTSGTA